MMILKSVRLSNRRRYRHIFVCGAMVLFAAACFALLWLLSDALVRVGLMPVAYIATGGLALLGLAQQRSVPVLVANDGATV